MYDPVAFASILSDFLSLSTDIHSHMHNIVTNMMDAPQYLQKYQAFLKKVKPGKNGKMNPSYLLDISKSGNRTTIIKKKPLENRQLVLITVMYIFTDLQEQQPLELYNALDIPKPD
jgi:hypothetical protein